MQLKTSLIIGGVGMVIGIGMITGGVMNGAEPNFTWDNGPKIVKIHTLHKTFTNQNIKAIQLNNSNNFVEIHRGTQWQVKMQSANANQSAQVRDGRLIVKAPEEKLVLTPNAYDQAVTITVPRHVNLDKLDIVSDDGSVLVDGINVKTANISSQNGGIRLQNYVGEQVISDYNDGDAAFENVQLNKLSITGGNGYINLKNVKLAQASDITTGQGNVFLNDLQAAGVDAKTTFGAITVDDDSSLDDSYDTDGNNNGDTKHKQREYQTGDQNNVLKIRSDSGDISHD